MRPDDARRAEAPPGLADRSALPVALQRPGAAPAEFKAVQISLLRRARARPGEWERVRPVLEPSGAATALFFDVAPNEELKLRLPDPRGGEAPPWAGARVALALAPVLAGVRGDSAESFAFDAPPNAQAEMVSSWLEPAYGPLGRDRVLLRFSLPPVDPPPRRKRPAGEAPAPGGKRAPAAPLPPFRPSQDPLPPAPPLPLLCPSPGTPAPQHRALPLLAPAAPAKEPAPAPLLPPTPPTPAAALGPPPPRRPAGPLAPSPPAPTFLEGPTPSPPTPPPGPQRLPQRLLGQPRPLSPQLVPHYFAESLVQTFSDLNISSPPEDEGEQTVHRILLWDVPEDPTSPNLSLAAPPYLLGAEVSSSEQSPQLLELASPDMSALGDCLSWDPAGPPSFQFRSDEERRAFAQRVEDAHDLVRTTWRAEDGAASPTHAHPPAPAPAPLLIQR
eukprot:tig00021318_g20195.t1